MCEQSENEKQENKVCPICGTTFSDYRRTGLVGCAFCYSVFRKEIKIDIESMQGKTLHIGKRPKEADYSIPSRLVYLRKKLEKEVGEKNFNNTNKIRQEIAYLTEILYKKENDDE